jgi:hypothetical protein
MQVAVGKAQAILQKQMEKTAKRAATNVTDVAAAGRECV